MKHTTEELLATARHYFPRNIQCDEPGYRESPELQRQTEARARASSQYGAYRAVLRALGERFPELHVENRSYSLQSTDGSGLDRCFDGLLDLPLERPEERRRSLQFLISFVVPYYVICSLHGISDGTDYPRLVRTLDLSPDEMPFVNAIVEEIETAFPGHGRMPPHIARTIVPDVMVYPGRPATLLGCLFSDDWLDWTPNA